MSVLRHDYDEDLTDAAKGFLMDQFAAPTHFTESIHLRTLIAAAMHIVSNCSWVQPPDTWDNPEDPTISGRYPDEDADEDEV